LSNWQRKKKKKEKRENLSLPKTRETAAMDERNLETRRGKEGKNGQLCDRMACSGPRSIGGRQKEKKRKYVWEPLVICLGARLKLGKTKNTEGKGEERNSLAKKKTL